MHPIVESKPFMHAHLEFRAKFDEIPPLDRDEFQLHVHWDYEIFVFISGDAEFIVEGTVYPLKPGSVLLMRPGELHHIKFRSARAYKRYVFNFSLEALPEGPLRDTLVTPFSERPLGHKNLYTADRFNGISPVDFLAPMEKINPETPYAYTAIFCRLTSILACLHEAFMTGEAALPEDSAIESVIAYINAHLEENLSTENLCNHFYMSTTKFNAFFREHTHMSVGHYIQIKRMYLARSLIERGLLPAEVCAQCGYHDYSTFFRAYKKTFGESPSKNHRR